MAAPTSLLYAPVAATITARKTVQTWENLAQDGLGDLVEVRAGHRRQALRAIEAPLDLQPEGWQDLYLPILKILEPKLASGAVMAAGDLDTCPEINIPHRVHLAIRKEGV
jgi:predicted O-methyltransferase YrrM